MYTYANIVPTEKLNACCIIVLIILIIQIIHMLHISIVNDTCRVSVFLSCSYCSFRFPTIKFCSFVLTLAGLKEMDGHWLERRLSNAHVHAKYLLLFLYAEFLLHSKFLAKQHFSLRAPLDVI